jgi:hypothetical protein
MATPSCGTDVNISLPSSCAAMMTAACMAAP